MTLSRFIIVFYGTDSTLQTIPHIQPYITNLCHNQHVTSNFLFLFLNVVIWSGFKMASHVYDANLQAC